MSTLLLPRLRTGLLVMLAGLLTSCAWAQQSTPVVAYGKITGTVVAGDGSLLEGADLTLTTGSYEARDVSAADGTFVFADVPSGPFAIVVSAPNLAPVRSEGLLASGENKKLPAIALKIVTANAIVNVTETSHDVAYSELKQEEKQRVIGFIPNYYVSYDIHAQPLDNSLKAQLVYKATIDPLNFPLVAIGAVIEQATDTLNFGQNLRGFEQRYGVNFADFAIGNLLGGYAFPVLFRQDPRYFVKGTGSIKSRLWYAITRAVVARGDNLKWQPAYANIAGELGSGAMSNIYYPAANRNGVSLTFINTAIGLAGDAAGNVAQEFIVRHFSQGVPKKTPPPSPTP